MTFPFFSLIWATAGEFFLSSSTSFLYKYWTRRRRRRRILEHNFTWFDCNEANPMIKLMPYLSCTTGFHHTHLLVDLISLRVRWWWGPSTHTHTRKITFDWHWAKCQPLFDNWVLLRYQANKYTWWIEDKIINVRFTVRRSVTNKSFCSLLFSFPL